jgi:psp operon transcriptional activator
MRDTERIIGNSPTFNMALEQISRMAPVNRPVLVVGERGTGKELVAERLHYLSPRWESPLVKVNCAAMAENLLESELFGHEQGAFTGATRSHRGRFERADGGTLFLDELGTMSLRLQEKLLRVLEYGEFERLGGHKSLQVDVRVIGATNADLRQMAQQGEFRDDLLDRLSFDVLHLPPLRHRLSDIPELAHHFAVQMCRELEWEYFPGFTDRAALQLLQHPWPGNVRELKNAVERSLYRWDRPEEALGEVVLDPFDSPYADPAPLTNTMQQAQPADAPPTAHPGLEVGGAQPFASSVARFEKQLLRNALQQHNFHQGKTAEALKLSYDQLRGLLRKYQLTGKPERSAAADPSRVPA